MFYNSHACPVLVIKHIHMSNKICKKDANICTITIDMLLFGDLNMSNDDKEFITLCVQKYIHETKRF